MEAKDIIRSEHSTPGELHNDGDDTAVDPLRLLAITSDIGYLRCQYGRVLLVEEDAHMPGAFNLLNSSQCP
jgi:hypothetical protein